ncbi:TPA: hypothetical protein RRD46_005487 [Klebsiella pneumoniae]|nr:hypothetical protein [Klebsiella pneumoniae]
MSNKMESLENEINEISEKLVSLLVEREWELGGAVISMDVNIEYFAPEQTVSIGVSSATIERSKYDE